jgi:4-aminobutyrate aminotransferase
MSSDRHPVPHLVTEIPGPRTRDHVARDEAITSPSLPRAYPFAPVRGEGCTLEDLDGNRFLDFNAGIAVNSTGHAHPRVVAAIQAQAAELLHYSASDFYLPIYARTCEALAATAPFSGPARVFLGNSGTEAVEAALKLARRATGRSAIVGFEGGFHGRTYGSLTLTASKAKYHAGFGPLLPGVHHAPFGRVADLAWFDEVLFERITPPGEVAAIVVEPIQGEGGYRVPEPGFIAGLRSICDAHGILLVADEVQSGAGRTGRMWAIEHEGVEPDIVVTAKGIASGMPLGGIIARAPLMERWSAGAPGSTYGGNPVACAASLATIALLQEGLTDAATARGARLVSGLRAIAERHPGTVTDIRGRGLMIGVELASATLADAFQAACFVRGLLVLECGRATVRLSPPLVVTEDEVDAALGVIEAAVAAIG